MEDWQKAARRLMAGEAGEAVRALGSTPEAARLDASPEAAAVAQAAQAGDTAALRAALSRLLSTPDGRALAEKLSRMGNGHG